MKYNKIFTSNLLTLNAPVPEELAFPLSQHIGSPAEPVVKKGDHVKIGQLIAKASGRCSANIHSSISGEIIGIKHYPHPTGINSPAILIKNDFENNKTPLNPIPSIKEASVEQLVQMVEDAGIVGMGGATFPTHIKLQPSKPIQEVIINGAECEPYLTADHRLMLERPKELFTGIKVLQKILTPKRIIIAIEDNKPDAIKTLKNYSLTYPNVEIQSLPTKYPQGAEKVLVRQVTGKLVNRLPVDVGVVVINVATTAQIGLTAMTGMPLIDRIVTVSGELMQKRQNYRVKLGTPIKYLLQSIANSYENYEGYKIICGGPMMGQSQHSMEVPVMKGTSGILAIPNYVKEEGTCIRCAKCVDNCPLKLMPIIAANKGIQADECMECGLCAYNCPASINLVERIRLKKAQNILESCPS